ncbi:apolipoprotein N-acyltransferase [Leptospirillum ferriphilum]|uniref:apolipoprotein N-acyltransferase n=1 Tax=Leptospirillum ferriphilum TaxID=178606 RepID=UPI00117B9FF5|nr:apolipoprotein N-acyltransferase [Leptospirillum ferriphilum]
MKNSLLSPLLAGTFLGFLFQNHSLSHALWWLSPMAFAPLWQEERSSFGRSFGKGFLFGLAMNVAGLFWLVTTMVHYGHVPVFLAVFGDVLLSAYMALYTGVFWAGTVFFRQKLPVWLLPPVAAALWTVLEGFRGILLTGFPWNPLGSLLFGHFPFLGMAALTGTTGLSFFIVLAGGILGELFHRIRKERSFRTTLSWSLSFGLLVSVWALAGHLALQGFTEKEPPVPIGLIQGNIPQDQKWTAAFLKHAVDGYLDLSQKALSKGAKLLVWPETALPVVWNAPPTALLPTVKQVESLPVPLVTGTLGVVRTGDETGYAFTNEAVLFSGKGKAVQRYRKRHLVPFGEYIPLPWLFGWLRPMTGITGDMRSGTKGAMFEVSAGDQTLRLAPFICYEALYPSLVREMALKGPDFLVVLSDDAWFGSSDAPYQLFRQSLLRAIENGIPLIRVANTGLSGVMEPDGSVLGKTSLFTRQEVTISLHQKRRTTFYRLHGEWVFRLSLLAILCLLAGAPLLRATEQSSERTVP